MNPCETGLGITGNAAVHLLLDTLAGKEFSFTGGDVDLMVIEIYEKRGKEAPAFAPDPLDLSVAAHYIDR
jgi:hypothetical protein